jgi:hypothetical protein
LGLPPPASVRTRTVVFPTGTYIVREENTVLGAGTTRYSTYAPVPVPYLVPTSSYGLRTHTVVFPTGTYIREENTHGARLVLPGTVVLGWYYQVQYVRTVFYNLKKETLLLYGAPVPVPYLVPTSSYGQHGHLKKRRFYFCLFHMSPRLHG